MQYEGMVYRPPSEARSLIIQVTIGCRHNQCTFCSMYKDKTFRVRGQQEIYKDLEEMRLFLSHVDSEGTLFRANHASNYLTLRGELNRDIPEILNEIDRAEKTHSYRLESLRGL